MLVLSSLVGARQRSRWSRLSLAEASSAVWTAWALRGCALVGRGARARGRIWVHGGGTVVIGRDSVLDGSLLPIELHAGPGAVLVLGDRVHVDGGASIEALASVTVGAGATLGRLCKIMDSNFHPLTGDRLASRGGTPDPVVIGDEVDIGPHAIILSGAHIAREVRVAAGAVVSRHRRDEEPISGRAASVRPLELVHASH